MAHVDPTVLFETSSIFVGAMLCGLCWGSARGEGALPWWREARPDPVRPPTPPPLDVTVPEVRAPYSDLATLLNKIGLI